MQVKLVLLKSFGTHVDSILCSALLSKKVGKKSMFIFH